jgi:hypothetical protein
MKEAILFLFIVCSLLSVSNYMMQDDIDSIKKEIVEIKKDYSYDPRDAK